MARVKPGFSVPVIKSLDEADAMLARIAAYRRQINLAELSMNEEVDAIKTRVAAETEPARAEIAVLEQSIIRYCDYNKAELFAKAKSLRLSFGIVGYRASTAMRLLSGKWTWERVLAALRDGGQTQCIRTKYEVDKEALKALPPENLASVGVKAVQSDTFFYELEETEMAAQAENTAA